MGFTNQTMIEGFRLKGITDNPELQVFSFVIILLIYLFSLTANLTILLLVCFDLHLHTPMYFFLSNLSVIDISSTTTTLHMIFVIFVTQNHVISTLACMAHLYIFCSLISNELSILAAMSIDRYVAVCRPLHYHNIMNQKVCGLLASVSWGFGFIEMVPKVLVSTWFTCYISKEVDHYFCDVLPIRDITCSDTSVLDFYILILGNVNILILLSLTIASYIFIITSILKISSRAGRSKVFFTCSSHLMVVVIFYSSIILQYIVTVSGNNTGSNKIFSLFNNAIVPLLNPLIYSLKNKDVKSALQRKLKLLKSL